MLGVIFPSYIMGGALPVNAKKKNSADTDLPTSKEFHLW